MRRGSARSPLALLATLAALALGAAPARGQQILIDKPVKAGELVVFPDLNDEKAYYYVSDKPHLASDSNGEAQFSFLRYVQNVRSDAGKAEIREGEGGGIVHALVELSVTRDQLQQAQRELQRVSPGARIVGPVIYKQGTFGLVSSFKDEKGGYSKQVVGLGKAPLLDGEKAAVSIQLTKLGAKVLWDSFDTTTPDISFSFEMEMGGFRSPIKAVIEADFDQIYSHEAFQAGLATTYLAAEIKQAFDDLRRSGAIKVTQVGQDEKMDALVKVAYDKLTDMMFTAKGGLDLEAAKAGEKSLLDRASDRLKASREETDKRNADIRKRNDEQRARSEAAQKAQREADAAKTNADDAARRAGEAQAKAEAAKKAYAEAKQEETAAEAQTKAAPSDAAAKKALEDARGRSKTAKDQADASQKAADDARKEADKARADATNKAAAVPSPSNEKPTAEQSLPSFSLLATFEMKTVHQSGKFRIDLNKYTADNLTLRFDENIGDLRALKTSSDHFRQVNLDDPLYQQREIVAMLDGLNADDFGQYVNFVTVAMRKTHAGGEQTTDEVRIDRKNFNSEGNAFKLLYGWNGDDDRRRWLSYEYQATWSFFGGRTVEQGWRKASAPAIDLVPPYQRRVVNIEASPEPIAAAGVRTITVRLYYDLGGGEQVKQVTLNAAKQQLSSKLEFMLPADKLDYAYEVSWHLTGDRTVSSGRRTGSESLLLVDELPAR